MKTRYLALLRGINVGGRNVIPMEALRRCVADLGGTDVATYIQSGNVLFDAVDGSDATWSDRLEGGLSERFGYDASVVLRTHDELQVIVDGAPSGFGADPDRYREDVLFLRDPRSIDDAMAQVRTRDGVDAVAAGNGVVYFSRLDARASQSYLSKIVGQPIYKQLTIRNWRTTTRLLALMDERAGERG